MKHPDGGLWTPARVMIHFSIAERDNFFMSLSLSPSDFKYTRVADMPQSVHDALKSICDSRNSQHSPAIITPQL